MKIINPHYEVNRLKTEKQRLKFELKKASHPKILAAYGDKDKETICELIIKNEKLLKAAILKAEKLPLPLPLNPLLPTDRRILITATQRLEYASSYFPGNKVILSNYEIYEKYDVRFVDGQPDYKKIDEKVAGFQKRFPQLKIQDNLRQPKRFWER